MRHTVNTEGFEVLSAFKSNHSVGRAMPKLMKGCAMGMAAMGASRVSKGVEERKLFFGEAAQGMNKEKSSMKLWWHGSRDFAHDPGVIPANVGHVCASTGAVLGSHMGAGKVHQWFQHLCRACEEIQRELVGIFNDPPSVHAHAIVV